MCDINNIKIKQNNTNEEKRIIKLFNVRSGVFLRKVLRKMRNSEFVRKYGCKTSKVPKKV